MTSEQPPPDGYFGPPPTSAGQYPYPDQQYPAGSYPNQQYPAGSYPGAGYPGAGYQPGPPMPYYAPGPYPAYPIPQSNGLAVAALITGILGFFCISSFIAIGLGIAGLQQSKRTGVGRAMSIWGICLGAAWLLGVVALIISSIASSGN